MGDNITVCPVCGEIGDTPHQIHYGGVACFSCRAFFRRAHQKTKAPKFVCKRGGDCEINVQNRRKCQKCRYDQCLQNGMKPEAVLTDDQKKVRFRNMIRKRASRKTEAYVSRDIIEDTDDSSDEEPSQTSETKSVQKDNIKQEMVEIKISNSPDIVPSPESGLINLGFELPMDDDYIASAPLSQEPAMVINSTITTPSMSPAYNYFNPPSTSLSSRSLSPSRPTSTSSRSLVSSDSSPNRSSCSGSPYSSPPASSLQSFSSPPSPKCCQSSPSFGCGPKISIGGFNKKKMAVSGQRTIFLMPCYNYCPIANKANRGPAKNLASGQDCECGSAKPCSTPQTPNSCGSGEGGRLKLSPRPQRAPCPIIGDIEAWPPTFESDVEELGSETEEATASKFRRMGHHLNEPTWSPVKPTAQHPNPNVTFTPQISQELDSGFSSGGSNNLENPVQSSWSPIKSEFSSYGPKAFGFSIGKTMFEGQTKELPVEDHIGQGPFLFDINSVPPAPSRRGNVEVERLIHAYKISGTQMDVDSEFIKRLIAFHKGFMVMPRSLLKNYLTSLAQQFRHFALQHKRFIMLNKTDQRKLLSRNSPLYIQYIMGKYFSASTGAEQIRWLLGSKCPNGSELEDVQRIGLHDFNAAVKLFRKGTYMDMYEEFSNRLSLTNTEISFNPVMSHFFLFDFDSSDRFVDPDTIAELHADSFRMCPHSRHFLTCSKQPNITGVIETCEAMSNFFSTNAIWNDFVADSDELISSGSESSASDSCFKQRTLSIPYSQEEENWFCNQMQKFNEAYAAVPLGEDIIKEYVMYSYDVPVSKHFVPVTLSVISQRFQRIMMMHQEFDALSSTEKARLFRSNTMNAVALYVAKMESCKGAAQQCQFAFGALDDTIFDRDYSHVIKANKMRKMSIFETNKSTHLLTERMMSDLERLVTKISPIICELDTFKLICLITLFTGAGDTMPSIARLRNKYLTVLRRRPNRGHKKMKFEFGDGYNETVYKQFTSCMCDIQELAALMIKIKSCMPDSFGGTFN